MKVLIVDDSKTMRNYLSAIVRELAIEVEQAADGEEALRCLAESGPFDLAMVDWNMPGMNGISLVRRIRENTEWNEVKVMMVTARNEKEAVIEAVCCGADDFLMKPMTAEMVEDKLRILGLVA
jgi:two-component system chemotaxis response regulator CheY